MCLHHTAMLWRTCADASNDSPNRYFWYVDLMQAPTERVDCFVKKKNTETMLEAVTEDERSSFALCKCSSRCKRQAAPKFLARHAEGTWAKPPKDRAEAFSYNIENRLRPHRTAGCTGARKFWRHHSKCPSCSTNHQ